MIRDCARRIAPVALVGAFAILIFLAPLSTVAQSGPSGGNAPRGAGGRSEIVQRETNSAGGKFRTRETGEAAEGNHERRN
jgi:hypothetical protein